MSQDRTVDDVIEEWNQSLSVADAYDDLGMLVAEIERLRAKAAKKSLEDEADHNNQWGGSTRELSWPCQQGGYEHDFCDWHECECICHRDAA